MARLNAIHTNSPADAQPLAAMTFFKALELGTFIPLHYLLSEVWTTARRILNRPRLSRSTTAEGAPFIASLHPADKHNS